MTTAVYGSLPFAEAIAFLRDKLDIPAERWTDLWRSAHDRGFMVAGATKADLIADLHAAVLKAREQGTTLAQFRKDFEALVARHGWTGWTGEDTPAGRAWRTRTIYETNLRASYQAGRYAQMTDPAVLKWRPFWRYKHSDSVRVPRPHHLAWNGLVLRAGDPWWRTHYPPNGWGCKCRAFALSQEDLKKLGKDGPDPTPDDGFYEWTDKQTGEIHLVPKGIDPGWDYAPGASIANDLRRLALEKSHALGLRVPLVARDYVADLVKLPLFNDFFQGRLKGEYPIAVLDQALRQKIDAIQPVVVVSQETLEAHQHHPEIGVTEYALAQRILDEGEVYRQDEGRLIALWQNGEVLYRAALKRTGDKRKNYWLTLFVTNEELATKQVRERLERIR